MSQAHGLFEVSEPIAAPLDVEDVTMVQEPVEDGGDDGSAWCLLKPATDGLCGDSSSLCESSW